MGLIDDVIEQAQAEGSIEKRRATLRIKKGEFPINQNFECPYCHYVGKASPQGTARIYSDRGLFICFSCHIERKVELCQDQKKLS